MCSLGEAYLRWALTWVTWATTAWVTDSLGRGSYDMKHQKQPRPFVTGGGGGGPFLGWGPTTPFVRPALKNQEISHFHVSSFKV